MSSAINFETNIDYASMVIQVTDKSHQNQLIKRIKSMGQSL